MNGGTALIARAFLLLSLLGTAAALSPASDTLGQAPGVATTLERRIAAPDPPASADVYHSVLEFEPGAWTIHHSHNGPSYNTVLEGEVTLRIGDVDRTFRVGEGWVDEPGVDHTAGNLGAVPAKLLASFVVTSGVAPSAYDEPEDEASLPPEPTPLVMQKLDTLALPRPLEVVHRVVELAPGASVVAQAQSGPSLLSVVKGSVTVHLDGAPLVVAAGDSWAEAAGLAHSFTAGDVPTRVIITTFAARDAEAGAPVEQAAAAPAESPR